MKACNTLLVVDDNEMNRDLLCRRLQRKGYKPSAAENGKRALELASKKNFDLILLDVMMPDISGLDVLQTLRKEFTMGQLPIIMVTAKHEGEDIIKALDLGANDYVTKPIDFRVLFARIESQLARKHAEALLADLAWYDPLTGLYNRHHLDRSLPDELKRAQRYQHPLTLLLLDLDGFKQVNDQLGHPKGDEVLKQVGKLIQETLRSTDLVFRYGGDEFLAMLIETNGDAGYVVDRLKEAMKNWVKQSDINLPLDLSVGSVTWYPGMETDADDLLREADQLLYTEKRGKDISKIQQGFAQKPHQMRFQAAFLDHISEFIVVTDLEGKIIYANQAFTPWCRCDLTKLIGTFLGEKIPEFTELVKQVREKRFSSITIRQQSSTSPLEVVQVCPSELKNERGTPYGYIYMGSDITKKREGQEQLQQSERRYRQLIEFSPDIIYIHDGERVTFINQTGVRLFGAKNEHELIGRSVQSLVHPKDWTTVSKRIKNVLAGKQDTPFIEQRFIRLDGTSFEVEVGATSFMQRDQQAVLVLARDIHEKKQLQDELMRTTVETITLLAKTVDEKDKYTAGHCERLSKLAINVGRAMGMNEKKLEQLHYAALLHDLGKISIPDEVLNKPAELSNAEWVQIKEHPSVGAELIEKIHALKPVSKIVLQHHERWDGKGYPQGLKGESILAGARILSVVDAYDAMTTDRPYRQALSKKSAVDELRQGNGTQFDPNVVDTFLKLLLEI